MASDGSGGCSNIPRIKVKWLNANGIKLCRLTLLDHILWSFSSFGCVNPFRFGWLVGRSVRLNATTTPWKRKMIGFNVSHTWNTKIRHKQASKQASQLIIPRSSHCLILALSYSCLRRTASVIFASFAKHHELSFALPPSVITRIFIGIILISFSTPINFCHARAEAERKLLTQTCRIQLQISINSAPWALSLHYTHTLVYIFLLMLATAHSFNCERYNCTSEILWLMLIADVCFSYLPVICLPVNASLDFALAYKYFIIFVVVVLSG